jgi:hypothetical protein
MRDLSIRLAQENNLERQCRCPHPARCLIVLIVGILWMSDLSSNDVQDWLNRVRIELVVKRWRSSCPILILMVEVDHTRLWSENRYTFHRIRSMFTANSCP